MIQPLHADFLAGALAHRLLDEVAGLVCEQRVHPHQAMILRLLAELRLAVDRPAHQPGGILHRHDAAGHDLAGERIALADGLDIRDNSLIERFNGSAHPVGLLGIVAEFVRMAERRILRGNSAPHIPAAAGLNLRVIRRRRILAAHRGIFHAAAVGDKDEIVFRQADALFLAVPDGLDRLGNLALRRAVEQHVHNLHAEMELHSHLFKVFHHRQDHRFILIILRKAQRLEIRQAADMVDVALQIQLHFQRAVPVFKGKHRAPVEPEVAVEYLVVENIGNALILQLLVRREEQLHNFRRALIGNIELAVRMRVFAAVHRCAAEGVVRVGLIEPVIFVQHAHALGLDGRNGMEQVPHHFEVVIHLAASAHHVADVFKLPAVARAAGQLAFFKDVNMLALHLSIADEIAGGSQRGKAAADNISRLMIDAFGLAGTGKRLIVTAGIIHTDYLLHRFCSSLCHPVFPSTRLL